MALKGPIGKSVEQHKRDGTFRPNRHSDKPDVAPPVGSPIKPEDIADDESASHHWDRVVAELLPLGLIGSIDASAIAENCRLWSVLQDCHSDLSHDRRNVELIRSMLAVERVWQQSAATIGLTPIARQRMRIEKASEEKATDPFTELMKKRANRSASN